MLFPYYDAFDDVFSGCNLCFCTSLHYIEKFQFYFFPMPLWNRFILEVAQGSICYSTGLLCLIAIDFIGVHYIVSTPCYSLKNTTDKNIAGA